MSLKKTTPNIELTKPEKLCRMAYYQARKLAGMNPTAEEVGECMGRSRFTAARLLKILVGKGLLVQNGQKARCYGVPKRKKAA